MGNASQPIFLYGPPASGKTTLGERLARALRRQFIDLDAEIERRAGKAVSAIFRDDGEPAFRALEASALRDMSAGKGTGAVVALGGGTLLDPANRAVAEASGPVWRLESPPPEELARRIASKPGSRPLGDKARERAAHYASFPRRIAATFDLGDSLVVVGENLGGLGGLARVAVADATAAHLHPGALDGADLFSIPSGEEHKCVKTVCAIWEALRERAVTRHDRIMAFGGGVTGDMAGFAAATWMRGIGWINVPTTLLSMVDASTGGKTGFDLPEGKNLVGAFHPPALVVIDAAYLGTLPPREIASGQAEMIKHEIISGRLRPSVAGLPTAKDIADNLSVKVGIVMEDPHETKGLRMLLNCGHTIGHAVEAASGYTLSHGEAVAIGCVEEARLAVRMGLAPAGWPETLAGRFRAASLLVEAPQFGRETLARYMASDKKREGNGIVFALPCGWGDVRRVTVGLETLA